MCYHLGRLPEDGRVSVEMGTVFAALRDYRRVAGLT